MPLHVTAQCLAGAGAGDEEQAPFAEQAGVVLERVRLAWGDLAGDGTVSSVTPRTETARNSSLFLACTVAGRTPSAPGATCALTRVTGTPAARRRAMPARAPLWLYVDIVNKYPSGIGSGEPRGYRLRAAGVRLSGETGASGDLRFR